jgi:hypothetical protein
MKSPSTSKFNPEKKRKSRSKMIGATVGASLMLSGLGALGRSQGGTGSWLGDIWSGGKNLFGGIFGGGAKGSIGGLKSGSMDAIVGSRKIASSQAGSGGIGGFFSNMFSSGESMIGFGTVLNSLGAFFTGLDDTDEEIKSRTLDIREKLGMRALDIEESLGEDQLAINRMNAENAIRQTAIGSTFLGHPNPMAMVEGVEDPGPGLIVGRSPQEVAGGAQGILGMSSPGTISQGTVGRLV